MNWKNYFNIHKGYIGALLLICAIVLAQGCSEGGKGGSLIVVGSPAPSFGLTLFDGPRWTMDAHEGAPVVIAFMASWCPCSSESAPFLKEAYARYNPQGVEFLLVGIQDSASKFKRFLEEKEVAIPAGHDEDGSVSALYGVDAPPVTVFIDREHRVRRIYFGNIKEVGTEFFSWIEEVL